MAPLEQATPADPVDPVDDIDALLEPYRAFIDGRSAIEPLEAREVARALRPQPDLTAAHIGLASAYLLQYEATRADACPDHDALTTADRHARGTSRPRAEASPRSRTLLAATVFVARLNSGTSTPAFDTICSIERSRSLVLCISHFTG